MQITRYELELYERWQMEAYRIEDVRYVIERHMREYLIYLQRDHRAEKPLAEITVNHCFMNVKKLFDWLQQSGLILNNPGQRISSPKWTAKLPRALEEAEMKRLIESPDTKTVKGLRDRAMMELLYGTGIRHKECWKLNIYDVDVVNKRLTVRMGKGGNDRVVPITKESSYWLGQYLGQARRELAGGGGKLSATSALWLSRDGYRLSYGRIESVIKEYARELEIEVTVHVFRHIYATHLLRGGADIRHIQRLLGHKDIQSTTIYTHLEISDLQKTVAKLG